MTEPYRLGPEDASAMATIHGESFAEGWEAQAFARLVQNPASRAFGLARDGRLAAFALFTLVHDEAEIITICTAASAREKGLGRQLLEGAIAALAGEGAEKIFLDVAEDNLPAVKLYTACGFIRYGRREGYYHGVDAVLMLRHV